MIVGASSSSPPVQQTPFGPAQPSSSGGGASVLFGLLTILVGPIIWRIYCELLIVIFKIHSELVAIRTASDPGPQGFPVIPPQP